MAVAAETRAGEGGAPPLLQVRELARHHNLIPLCETFIDDCQTPVSAFLKLRDPTHPSFLLESAEQGRVGRYSFIGFRPRKVLRWSLGDPGDPYALAADELRRFRVPAVAGLPPFAGGAVGMFAYDLVRTVEPLGEPNPDPLGVPDLALMLTDALVVFDHLKRTTTVVANVYPDDDLDASYRQALETIAEVRWRLARPLPAPSQRPAPARLAPRFQSNLTRGAFEANVARIIEYIYAGDAFQVVPSQRWSAAVPVDAFSIYRGLRAVNPSPYMYFLDFGDFEIAGASPEPLITVAGRRVATRPIAGRLRPEVDALDALRSVLPAGTLSGAPKVRAMQIIDELEPVKRGGYGGAIGWVSYTGELDTCIHIRTVVVKDGVAHVQAGGGTVADAKPDYEFRESEAKARAVLQAIELAVAQPDWG